MASVDGYLRGVPSDTDQDDGRLYDPTQASGSVTYVLSCAVGTYIYTGQTATLTVARKLTLDAGAYTYTGQDATLTYVAGNVDYVLACDAGEYAYIGNNATLTYTQGIVNYDTHDGGDVRKRDKRIKEEKEKLREMLTEAFDVAQGIALPKAIQEHKALVPALVAKLTEQDIAEVKAEVNLLLSQIYMQAAIQKAAQDEDDVETLMLLNG